MVVVRLNWGGPREGAVAAARGLGNTIIAYREKAMAEEATYALRLDLDGGRWKLVKPADRTMPAVEDATALAEGNLQAPLRFGEVCRGTEALSSCVVVFLGPKGILPDLSIEILGGSGHAVTVRPDPVVNEVSYEER